MHKFYVKPEQLKAELLEIEKSIPKNVPVMIHSDIMRVGFPCLEVDPEIAGQAYEKLFLDVFSNRAILLPTFCYDYCASRVFNVEKDLGQVGFLSRYMVQKHSNLRSKTPVFNFVILNNDEFCLAPSTDAFGKGSIYEQFFSKNGVIILLGVGILQCTPLMYVEARANVLYRYSKKFPGVIIDNLNEQAIEFSMPVRPLNPDIVEYSNILEIDLLDAGIMKQFSTGYSESLVCQSNEFFDFFNNKLIEDPFYPLTNNAKSAAHEFCQKNDRFSFDLCE